MSHLQPATRDAAEPIHRLTLSTREVADLLGMSYAGVRNLIRSGVIPSLKLGNRRLVRTDALAELLAQREGGAS